MITAVVLTKNEEKNIEASLMSVQFCDKVIIIDDASIDTTIEKAKKYNTDIFTRRLAGSFSDQRNFALSQVKTEWALFLDADETISKKLQTEIVAITSDTKYNGFYIKRKDELFGKKIKYGELMSKKFIRLGRVKAGAWKGAVHEVWEIKGVVKTLSNPLIHKPHQSIQEFISEIDGYATLRAQELYTANIKSSFISILFLPVLKFMYLYIVKLGFMDGVAGLVISIIMSLYTFLTRSKLFLLSKHS